MKTWNLRGLSDSSDHAFDLESVEACDPEEAVERTFGSDAWEHVGTTRDEAQPCYHYRLPRGRMTIFVWENE
jgi:hypothetical protein